MKSSILQSSRKSKSTPKSKSSYSPTTQLQDKRKLTQDQQHLIHLANKGKSAVQLKAFDHLLNGNATLQKMDLEEEEPIQGKFENIQKQGLEEEELMQGKFKTIQKMGLEEEEPLQGKFETIQKQGLEEEELMQGKFKTIQKMELEEEEPLQGKFETIQKQGMEEEELMQGKFETIQRQENNTGLPDNLKSGIENLSGYSMDDVKVHYNSDKPATLQAHAYAQGTDIHIASGQEKHLPHEAWHVVQQKQGRVKPTIQLQGKVNVNDDAGLEQEADVMG
uniref:eCIS core domain-containing protein n=1 Tax=Aquiflexum sp. TaxID=1872584 RepID=UPI003593173E